MLYREVGVDKQRGVSFIVFAYTNMHYEYSVIDCINVIFPWTNGEY